MFTNAHLITMIHIAENKVCCATSVLLVLQDLIGDGRGDPQPLRQLVLQRRQMRRAVFGRRLHEQAVLGDALWV